MQQFAGKQYRFFGQGGGGCQKNSIIMWTFDMEAPLCVLTGRRAATAPHSFSRFLPNVDSSDYVFAGGRARSNNDRKGKAKQRLEQHDKH